MLIMHGGTWLTLKADGAVAERAARVARLAGLFTAGPLCTRRAVGRVRIEGYAVSGALDHSGPSNPAAKTVLREAGTWINNPWLIAAPVLGIAGSVFVSPLARRRAALAAFVASAIGVAGIIATAGVSLFPFLMPSSTHPAARLTVWDASSSRLTLFIMLLAVVVFLPVVLGYTGFVLRVMRGRVRFADVERPEALY